MYLVLGWRGYIMLVFEAGWTPEQYAERIAETMTRLLLPDEPSSASK